MLGVTCQGRSICLKACYGVSFLQDTFCFLTGHKTIEFLLLDLLNTSYILCKYIIIWFLYFYVYTNCPLTDIDIKNVVSHKVRKVWGLTFAPCYTSWKLELLKNMNYSLKSPYIKMMCLYKNTFFFSNYKKMTTKSTKFTI